MIRLNRSRAALLAAALALQPLAAMAQAPAATPVSAGTDTALPKDEAAKLEQHNKQLHEQLGITAAEQPQWDKFTEVTRSNALDMRRAVMDRSAKLDTMNAADSMQSYADLAKLHAANMDKAASSFQALYASFSPQQKAAADKLFRNRAEAHAAKKG